MRQNAMKFLTTIVITLLVVMIGHAQAQTLGSLNQGELQVLQAEMQGQAANTTAEKIAKRGVDYLASQGQAEDGSFSSYAGTGVTSLAATALLKNGVSPKEPVIQKALAYLKKHVQPDGGIYTAGGFWKNYETSVAIVCFTEANRDGQYDDLIANAEKFLKDIQWDENEDKTPADMSYGGAGYGKHKRPDLSNTSFFIDALKNAGTDPNDPALEKALTFVERCQNFESASNSSPFAAKNPDGGFFYTAAAGGESKAGETPQGGLRSYGSMTYAGLKSMIYAGLKPDDPRVKAAVKWISKNYTLKNNPGMGDSGLFYYYHTFAKALQTLGMNEVIDADGKRHNWREDLVAELAARQKKDGSWVNTDARWLEGDPNLVTAYVLLALASAEGK